MPKWTKPIEGMPEVEVGDRVAIIVRERPYAGASIQSRLVILEATETGWRSPDDTYAGYAIEDGILWSTERDICGIAEII